MVEARAGGAWDGAAEARRLLRTVGTAALATLDRDTGAPFASLTTVATDADGSPLVLISGLSAHTANLDGDPRASLLLAALGRGDPLAHPRLTLSGRMEPAGEGRVRRRFLSRHPKAELYVDLPDFSFRRLRVEAAHLNGGFGKAGRFRPGEILADLSGAAALVEGEADALATLNAGPAEALRLCLSPSDRVADPPCRAIALDPEGIDLSVADRTVRLVFPARVTDPASLPAALAALARQAGARDS